MMAASGPLGSMPTMRSPAHRLHAGIGAAFRSDAGWEIPASYGDPDVERARLTEAVGVCDISARGKVDVRGSFDGLGVAPGAGLEARISDVWALLLTEPGGAEPAVTGLEAHLGPGAMVTDVTHLYSGIAVAGPLAWRLFERLTPFDVTSVPAGEAVGARVADLRGVVVRRDLPDVPEVVLELYVGSESGRFVWQTLLDEASEIGGGAVGWDGLREGGWRPC